jgi:hypothetical protein
VQTNSNGSGHLVTWYDIGVDAGVPTETLRAAVWSSGEWSPPIGIPLYGARITPWPGTGYVLFTDDDGVVDLVRVSSTGTLLDTLPRSLPIAGGGALSDLACTVDRCLVRYTTSTGEHGRFTFDANLTVAQLGPPGTAGRLIPYESGFAGVSGVDGDLQFQLVTADGDVTESVDVTPDVTLPTGYTLSLSALPGGVAVVWRTATDAWARKVSSSLTLGPVVTVPLPGSAYAVAVVSSGPGLLFTWSYEWVRRTIYGLQTDANLNPLGEPFEIANVDSIGFGFDSLSSDGTTALSAWTHLDSDPTLLTERLAVRSITAH